jgi:predicted nucleotidyltransferase
MLAEIVARIAEVHPRARVILFGSRAAGRPRPDSDYDLVVVTPDLRPDEPPAARIRAALRGLSVALDLIVVSPSEWEEMRVVRHSVAQEASRHGFVVRDAA